jgi:hypothetical protein
MLNIPGHKGNANQNQNNIPPYQEYHQKQMLSSTTNAINNKCYHQQTIPTTNAGKDVG